MIYLYWIIGIFVYIWVGSFIVINFVDIGNIHKTDEFIFALCWPILLLIDVGSKLFNFIFNKITPKIR